MTKFNVGDKVRFIEDYMDYKKGDIVEVVGFWGEGINYIGKGKSTGCYFNRVELVEPKPTKNQRIKALETEVAELKLIVHELRDRPQLTTVVNNLQEPSTINTVEDIIEFEGAKYKKVDCVAREGDLVVFNKIPESGIARKSVIKGKPYKVHESDGIYKKYINDEMSDRLHVYGGGVLEGTPETVDVYELIEDKPSDIFLNGNPATIEEVAELMTMPTPNQQRAEIIEKAKKFVEKFTTPNSLSGEWRAKGAISWNGYGVYPEFFVNENKRIVTLVFKGAGNPKKILKRTFAKCNPSDVFNQHIGKAIALGRALNIDVSEFEQAVQPNEIVVGHKIEGKFNDFYEITAINENTFSTNPGSHFHKWRFNNGQLKIINDTDAIYGGVE